jgi:hypothetical protein
MIALYAGGELTPGRARRVEMHLRECASCRALADDLAADRAALERLGACASHDLELGSIRAAVMAEVTTLQPAAGKLVRSPRLALAAVAVAAAVALVAFVATHGERRAPRVADDPASGDIRVVEIPPEVPEVAPEQSGEAAPEAPAVAEAAAEHQPPTRIARTDPPAGHPDTAPGPGPEEPMLIKILTDDPEVVIYWIVELKGEEEHV